MTIPTEIAVMIAPIIISCPCALSRSPSDPFNSVARFLTRIELILIICYYRMLVFYLSKENQLQVTVIRYYL